MPNICIVPQCRNSSDKTSNVSFFAFPANKERRNQWSLALNVSIEDKPRSRRWVCSRHFSEEEYFRFPNMCKLKAHVTPHLNLPTETMHSLHSEVNLDIIKTEPLEEPVTAGPSHTTPPTRRSKKRYNFVHQRVQFNVQMFKKSNQRIMFYTGLPNFQAMLMLFRCLFKSEEDGPEGTIFQQEIVKNQRYVSQKLTPLNELFLTLIRLRRGYELLHLGNLFEMSSSTASRVISCWVNLLYNKLKGFVIWPHRDVLIENTKSTFKKKYPNVIGSIICVEFNIERTTKSRCCTRYRRANTVKALLMINPNGAIIFVSSLFTGSISDRQILHDSEFIQTIERRLTTGSLKPTDIILADKRFCVRDLAVDVELEINVPTFKITGLQSLPDETQYIRQVSHRRVHVQRAVRRIQAFQILQYRIPLTLLDSINEIFTVCALLADFKWPLIKENGPDASSEGTLEARTC